MNVRLSIRPAVTEDIETLARLRRACRADGGPGDLPTDDPERMADGCILLAGTATSTVATAGLDLDSCEISEVLVAPSWQGQGIGRRMIEAVERLAVQFGILALGVHAPDPVAGFFERCGYRARLGGPVSSEADCGVAVSALSRSFPRRQTRFGAKVRGVLERVGIPGDYGRRHRLTLQEECRELATIGHDVFDREQWLAPSAADAWHRMRAAARDDGVHLGVASAFRTVAYQEGIIERKKVQGQTLEDILAVSAAPGFSEHHTGCALDIATSESRPLETHFENTPAFEWLSVSAQRFGFRLSFPRNNRHGIAYEPWHWMWRGG